MLLSSRDSSLLLQSGDAHIMLTGASLDIDGYTMDFPGEYERRGIFVEIRESHNQLLFILTIEGKTWIYLPSDTSADSLEVLRDLNNKDAVIFPAHDSLWRIVETWEALVLVPTGDTTAEFLTKLGQTLESSASHTIKLADFEGDKSRFFTLS
jgi:hypothetical protein